MPDLARRTTFGQDAERYDRARPGYPSDLFRDLAGAGAIPPGGQVLEVGCGTGQATRELLRRGYRVDAVELSPTLADLARRRLEGAGPFRVWVGAFEEWVPAARDYDAVVAAAAFHWVDPRVRYERAAAVLRPGGVLALLDTHHVAGGDRTFFERSQTCYEAHWPGIEPGFRLPEAADVPRGWPDLESSERFLAPVVRTYRWERAYRTAEYLELLRTYSDHASLPEDARERLLTCLGRTIDAEFGGTVRKAHLTELLLARRNRSDGSAPDDGGSARGRRVTSGTTPTRRPGPRSRARGTRSAALPLGATG